MLYFALNTCTHISTSIKTMTNSGMIKLRINEIGDAFAMHQLYVYMRTIGITYEVYPAATG